MATAAHWTQWKPFVTKSPTADRTTDFPKMGLLVTTFFCALNIIFVWGLWRLMCQTSMQNIAWCFHLVFQFCSKLGSINIFTSLICRPRHAMLEPGDVPWLCPGDLDTQNQLQTMEQHAGWWLGGNSGARGYFYIRLKWGLRNYQECFDQMVHMEVCGC